ncbi:ABC transporter substrate-binding protein (plasmid) [Agrobacterium leguminum]|uniref:ABC transporter substrate-binding protein n=1 Tax=Agrobacterium deltaense NCPPB 1641 TaxID=1183425 RepID=A0A1S7UAY9_9HYPH|nr:MULTISPECIES: ABC transporter substrate-binding protein [Agrobacterium]WFS69753.1 ABC transporter substrate-binding protein [Agrobacterium leguminum]CVI64063.1 putative ABC transporter substrate-binding protein [Agrobacterium deltaense NCPPB 1641]
MREIKAKSFRIGRRGFLATAALAVSLGSSVLSAPAAAESTITSVRNAPLRALDPVISTAYILRDYGYMVYDTLLALDANSNIMPQMASWSVSNDGKIYTLTLRDGLKWHDGTAVTADDCIASIKRWSQADKLGQIMASLVTDMKAVDEKSFTITLSVPSKIVLMALSKPSGVPPFMFPKKVAETPVGTPITSTIGSGPFKFVAGEYKPGVQAVFVKNTDYVPRSEPASGLAGGKVVKVDKVRWVSMPDPMTAVNALLSGEIDSIEQTPHDLLPLLEGNPDFEINVFQKQATQNLVRLNFTQPPFDNPKIRKAAALALGQQELLDVQVGPGSPYGKTCGAVFGCGSIYESDYGAADIISPHPEEAKKLLAEAGYDGKPVTLLHTTDIATLNAMGPVLAQQLRNGGFKVDMVSMDWASVVARRASKAAPKDGGWNIFSTGNVLPDVGSPLGFIGVAAGGPAAWFGWPDVPEIEAARAKLARTDDLEEAKKIGKDIHKLVIDNTVMIPMGEIFYVESRSTKLKGEISAEAPVFWNVEKVK